MATDSIEIRLLTTVQDCKNFRKVQARIWQNDPDDSVPVHVLITQAKNGGLLLGAYAAEGPAETDGMVGIAFGWPGLVFQESGQYTLKHCSHMVGVLPQWQSQGIGLRLKLAQRQALLDQDITDWVTWTYDPLQHINARLNIHRLGATCVTYLRNVYGEMTDDLNAGMPSDRCQVDWRLQSPRVRYALSSQRRKVHWPVEAMEILPTSPLEAATPARAELRQPVETTPTLDGTFLAVPLPESVSALRDHSTELLLEWRLFLRAALEAGFGAGYVLVDCVELPERGWHYVLVPQGTKSFTNRTWP